MTSYFALFILLYQNEAIKSIFLLRIFVENFNFSQYAYKENYMVKESVISDSLSFAFKLGFALRYVKLFL